MIWNLQKVMDSLYVDLKNSDFGVKVAYIWWHQVFLLFFLLNLLCFLLFNFLSELPLILAVDPAARV